MLGLTTIRGRNITETHYTILLHVRTCSSSIPPDDVPVAMVELAADDAPAVTVVVLSPLVVEDDLPT